MNGNPVYMRILAGLWKHNAYPSTSLLVIQYLLESVKAWNKGIKWKQP
jgi:hypothetical protein